MKKKIINSSKKVQRFILNKFKKIDKNILILFVVVTLSLLPLTNPGTISGHDTFFHMFRIEGVSQNIINFQIPSKIHYNSINGFGYGSGIFYPQLSILIPSIINLVMSNVTISLKVGIYIYTLLAAFAMYAFLKNKTKSLNPSLIGSIIYILSPYCFIQSMFRGAIGEMIGFLSLPIVFLGIDYILNQNEKGEIIFVIGAVTIILSHIISTIYIALFGLIYLLFNSKKLLTKQVILSFIKSFAFIILITSFFLVPLFQHKMYGNYNIFNIHPDPSKSIVYLSELLYSNGSNNIDIVGYAGNYELPHTISFLIVSILLFFPFVYSKTKKNNELKPTITFMLLGFITVFLMCSKIYWGYFEILDVIQFPWRLLMFTVFFLSVSCSYIVKNLDINNKNFTIFLMIIIILAFIQLNPYEISVPTQIHSDINSVVKYQTIDNNYSYLNKALGAENDYLPVEVSIFYIKNRAPGIIENEGNLQIIEGWKKSGNKFQAVLSSNENTNIELPLIHYLGYTIKYNSKSINYNKNTNGFISLNLEKCSNCLLEVEYIGTKLGIFSNYLSLISFILFIIYGVKILKKK